MARSQWALFGLRTATSFPLSLSRVQKWSPRTVGGFTPKSRRFPFLRTTWNSLQRFTNRYKYGVVEKRTLKARCLAFGGPLDLGKSASSFLLPFLLILSLCHLGFHFYLFVPCLFPFLRVPSLPLLSMKCPRPVELEGEFETDGGFRGMEL